MTINGGFGPIRIRASDYEMAWQQLTAGIKSKSESLRIMRRLCDGCCSIIKMRVLPKTTRSLSLKAFLDNAAKGPHPINSKDALLAFLNLNFCDLVLSDISHQTGVGSVSIPAFFDVTVSGNGFLQIMEHLYDVSEARRKLEPQSEHLSGPVWDRLSPKARRGFCYIIADTVRLRAARLRKLETDFGKPVGREYPW
jgi:hypothetical protein